MMSMSVQLMPEIFEFCLWSCRYLIKMLTAVWFLFQYVLRLLLFSKLYGSVLQPWGSIKHLSFGDYRNQRWWLIFALADNYLHYSRSLTTVMLIWISLFAGNCCSRHIRSMLTRTSGSCGDVLPRQLARGHRVDLNAAGQAFGLEALEAYSWVVFVMVDCGCGEDSRNDCTLKFLPSTTQVPCFAGLWLKQHLCNLLSPIATAAMHNIYKTFSLHTHIVCILAQMFRFSQRIVTTSG